jgi:hypothetical protein
MQSWFQKALIIWWTGTTVTSNRRAVWEEEIRIRAWLPAVPHGELFLEIRAE